MAHPSTLTANEAVAAELRAAAARKNYSRRDLAALLEVSPMWIQRRFTGAQSLSVEDVVRICAALDIDPRPILDHALTP